MRRQMFNFIQIFLWQWIVRSSSQQQMIIPPDKPDPIDIEPLIIDIRVPDIQICQEMKDDNCKNLLDQMLKCQQIIFNDPGFSYQQYKENIHVHRQILIKYQSMCEDTHSDYLVFDLKKD